MEPVLLRMEQRGAMESVRTIELGADEAACWVEEEIFLEGDGYLNRLRSAIEGARHSIDLEAYIFAVDEVGALFADALIDAARRGVLVRVLLDGVGSFGGISSYAARFAGTGVLLRVHRPVRFKAVLKWMAAIPGHEPLGRILRGLNRRNHRKMCIVDAREAWVGSLNISTVHSRSRTGDRAWRDTGVRVVGSAVRDLRRAFERVWYTPSERRRWSRGRRAAIQRINAPGAVRLNWKARQRRRNFRDLAARLKGAHHRIFITNAYFVPHGALLRALTKAAARGVDVRVLVPRRSDIFFMPWVARFFYGPLLAGGVRVFEYTRSMLHAKTVLVDEWGLIGSSNLNRRSLLHDLEVDVVIRSSSSLALMARAFEDDLTCAEELRRDEHRAGPWWQRLVARIGFYFRWWL